jgi:hypothetical protein
VVNSASALPPRERAWTLYCQGLRSPAISKQPGIPERTIRYWIDKALEEAAKTAGPEHERLRTLAVERFLSVAAAAWSAYESSQSDASGSPLPAGRGVGGEVSPARYLALALSAYREVARLQGLYIPVAPPPVPVDFVIAYRPEGPLDLEAMAAAAAAEKEAARQAAAAEAAQYDDADDYDDPANLTNPHAAAGPHTPAKTATPSPRDPQSPATPIAAKTANPPDGPGASSSRTIAPITVNPPSLPPRSPRQTLSPLI